MGAVDLSPGQATSFAVQTQQAGQRLDHFLVSTVAEQSRAVLLKHIKEQQVQVNGQPQTKASYRLRCGDRVELTLKPPKSLELVPEPMTLDIVFEDEHILVIHKPPGLVVHPGSGHQNGTLAHGLLYRHGALPQQAEGRPGIVHRLDKDTSGVMLIAKTDQSLRALMADFQNRRIGKTYHAILIRTPAQTQGRVAAPLGRHPVARQKRAIVTERGKYAATHWRLVESFANGWCLAEIGLETGRTHQIRVHMASLNAPVAGDLLYGAAPGRGYLAPARQMLHASSISFIHPASRAPFVFTVPFHQDMLWLLTQLRALER